MPTEEWGAHLLNGELTVHLVEGRNFGLALREVGAHVASGPQTCFVRVKRRGDKGYRTESKPVAVREDATPQSFASDTDRVPFDAKMTWKGPPAFDVQRGRLEFELVREDDVVLAKAHVGLQYLVHVSPGQTHTVSFLLVPKAAGDPPIRLARESAPGVKILIYPDFPSAAPSPTHMSEARTVGLSPRGGRRSPSPRALMPSPLPHAPPAPRGERLGEAIRAILVRVPEGRAFPGGVSKCALTFRGTTLETAVSKATPKPQWSGTQTFRFVVPEGFRCQDNYLHVRVLTDPRNASPVRAEEEAEDGRLQWQTLGSVDIELGHVAERGGVDTWAGVDAEMKSRILRAGMPDPGMQSGSPRRYTPAAPFPPQSGVGALPHQAGSLQTPVGRGSVGWVRVIVEFEKTATGVLRNAEAFWSERARKGLAAPTGRLSPRLHPTMSVPQRGVPMSATPIWSQDASLLDAAQPLPTITGLSAFPSAPAPSPAEETRRLSPPRGKHMLFPHTPDGRRAEGVPGSILDTFPSGEHVVTQPPPMWGVAGPIETLHKWLFGLGLDHSEQRLVAATLAKRGIRELATVLQLTEADLERLGFERGVRRKLISGIHA
eukprot:TRINITY_DN30000_c0_g1_i1.p1 TRINITY_DN30000_c0_g1~~TRINITY_DN30000_c0_g1_i1.p1  ORF type:complete len:603 (+),score=111.94 TRINITY_DN30000_c0_g1_i1:52-1860(+)